MKVVVALVLTLALVGCAGIAERPHETSMEKVTLTAADGAQLSANYYEGAERGVILLHQLNHDKSSWDAFARKLQKEQYSVIAIDLRGHGESQGRWQEYADKDFQAMLGDAEAAGKLLEKRGKRITAVLGASIGANTALRYSSLHNRTAVLLSPGLNYRGIDVNDVTSRASVLIVVADEDEYSAESSRELDANNLFGAHELLVVEGAEHGTYLLPTAGQRILDFLKANT